jgi:hypothetical protein
MSVSSLAITENTSLVATSGTRVHCAAAGVGRATRAGNTQTETLLSKVFMAAPVSEDGGALASRTTTAESSALPLSIHDARQRFTRCVGAFAAFVCFEGSTLVADDGRHPG